MDEDLRWVVDIIHIQITSLYDAMGNKKVRREDFDRYSYSVFALSETLRAIADEDYGMMTCDGIELLVKAQRDLYLAYMESNDGRYHRYTYCYEMMCELLKMIGVVGRC